MGMTKEEQIKDWFIHQFWPIYPGKWCRSGKGGRGEAMNAFLKKKKDADPEELRRILENLKAQIRADKGNPGRKWWVIGKTYCNNESWEDPVEDNDEQSTKAVIGTCHCGEPNIGPRYSVCPKHTESHAQRLEMMSILKQIGVAMPGQSLSELSQKCREYLQTSGASGKLLNKMTSSLKPADSGNQ